MTMLKNFKQSNTEIAMISASMTLAIVAIAGCVAVTRQTDALAKRVVELQKITDLNAQVTLNLVNVMGKATQVAE